MKRLRIGLLGLGQVGSGLVSILNRKKEFYEREIGVRLEIVKIAVRNKNKKRAVKVPSKLLTTDALEIVRDPTINIVVELIGGKKEAKEYVLEALRNGKDVVTANKALLAEEGDEIFELANRKKQWLLFEASVGGGIPVIKALREGLVANQIDSLYSIINGTSNYILTSMSEEQKDFAEALKEAQKKGYAEADPTFDIEGIDAAHKLALLARFAFGGRIKFSAIDCEGISRLRSEDIAFAQEFGYRIKLLAIAKKVKDGIEARVQPTLLPKNHILANVNGAFNAVLMHGDEVGDVLLYGRGAGPEPTASAVISDIMDIALRNKDRFEPGIPMRALRQELKVQSASSLLSRYYLRFHVVDRPGVLSKISHMLGGHRISISDVIQRDRIHGGVVPLIMLTHHAHETDVRAAIKTIDKQSIVRGKSQVIRIEGK